MMEKTQLLEVLNDWNFWKNELDVGRERRGYVEECLRRLQPNVVLAIIGVRRAGKSYIMRQMAKKLAGNEAGKKNVLMVNFEDKRFAEFKPELLDEVYDAYVEVLKPEGKPFVFLDEVHNVPKWERWVRTMHELGKAKIIVSGSSSKLLAGELASVLTGRHLDAHVFPLSFREFVEFRNAIAADELDEIVKKNEVKALFSEYLEFGGFPEVVSSSEKKQLLLAYFDDIVTKDIEKRYNVREKEKLRALARFYLTNVSNSVTFNSLKKAFETTINTIGKYSAYLEEAHLIFFVKRFSFKVKEQEKAARKVYAIDVGLANAVGFKFSANVGRIAENVAAIALKKKQLENPNVEVYHWKNKQNEEVDFVVKEAEKTRQLIQVCWDLQEYKTKERETKALLKASRELKCNDLLVITGDYEKEEKIKGKKIKYASMRKWLLEMH